VLARGGGLSPVATSDGRYLLVPPTGNIESGATSLEVRYADLAGTSNAGDGSVVKMNVLCTSPARHRIPGPKEAPDAIVGVASAGKDALVFVLRVATIETWNVATGELLDSRSNANEANRCVVAGDGTRAADSSYRGISAWDVETKATLWTVGGKDLVLPGMKRSSDAAKNVRHVEVSGFTTDGQILVAIVFGGPDGEPPRVAGFDAATGKPLWNTPMDPASLLDSVVVGAGVASVVENGRLSWLNTATGKRRESAPSGRAYTCAAVSRDGLTYWAGTTKGEAILVRTFDPPTAK